MFPMIKKHLRTIIITSAITLIPMIAGVLLWNRLPEQIPTHFGISGEADGWSSKPFAVFALPLFMLAMHLICILATRADPKHNNISDKVFTVILYIVPAISLILCTMIYPVALGSDINVSLMAMLFVGFVFVIIGNYLPKCKQSYTVGIKLPWTLDDSENWNKTHSLAGKLWVICGIIIIINAFLEGPYMFLPVVAIMVLVPTLYSYMLYKKKKDKSE